MHSWNFTWLLVVVPSAVGLPGLQAATELIRITPENYGHVVPAGKEIDAIYGDFVLRNEHLVAVIAQPLAGRKANMTVRGVGGMIIDLTRRHHGSDQLSCFYPTAGRYLFESVDGMQCELDGQPADLLQSKSLSGHTISLTLVGSPLAEDGTSAAVTYTLADSANWIAYRCKLTNSSAAALQLPVEDALRCDGDIFSDGTDPHLQLYYANDSYFGQCYGFMLDADTIVREGSGRSLRLKSSRAGNGLVEPGQSFSWSGKIHCSQGIAGVRSWAQAQIENAQTETMELKLQSPHGPIAHAEVELWREETSLGKTQSNLEGLVRCELLPGTYKAMIRSAGRELREHEFAIEAGKLHAVSLSLPAASRVRGEIVDGDGRPIAAKVQFFGIEGTSDPDFGPEAAAEAVKNVVYCALGRFEQAIDAGRYRVIVSHGPEYDAETREIEVFAGAQLPLNSRLPRTIDTRGWVSADFHSHSSPSGDNVSDQRGRVLNLLAEHIEFAPCTEHNRIDTYADDLLALHTTAAMTTCTGIELTGSPLPINHQNAFPLHRHEHEQDGGGPQADADPVKQIERLALWDNSSVKVVQSNHPNIPQMLGDIDLDGQPDGGFRAMFGWMDAIEVHPPEAIFTPPAANVSANDQGKTPIFYWLQLLNLGYRITGVVNTDAHYNFHGSGWLRNYLESHSDDPEKIALEQMIHSAEHGHVVMTNGPFLETQLRLGIGDARGTFISGEDVQLDQSSTTARLWIRVQCPNWFDVNRVQVFANGRPLEQLNFTRRSHADWFGNGPVRFEQEIELPKFEADTHLIVATIGEGLNLGPVMGAQRGQAPPVAVTNPIFVDIDGSGFQANGDDLGVPFKLPPIAN